MDNQLILREKNDGVASKVSASVLPSLKRTRPDTEQSTYIIIVMNCIIILIIETTKVESIKTY